LGGFAEIQGDKLRMRGFVATPDGSRMLRAEHIGDVAQPEALGELIAQELLKQGAGEILAALND
jgi:hydroxymethylbilane synthase